MSEQARNPDQIFTNSTIGPDGQPLVFWAYQQHEGTWSLENARERAAALFSAAAIAESEAAIARTFLDRRRHKAEGMQPSEEKRQAGHMLISLRDNRPPLLPGINPIFGMHTELPIIECHWFKRKTQLDPADARALALTILSAAEASESDRFLYYFFSEKLDLPREEIAPLIQEFQYFRQKESLNRLLGK